MRDDIKSEARQLPYMLGKMIGGIMCAISAGGFIYGVTRFGNSSGKSLVLFACAGIAGCAIFIISSQLSRKKAITQAVQSKRKMFGQNALAWAIFIGIAALFIGFIFAFTG